MITPGFVTIKYLIYCCVFLPLFFISLSSLFDLFATWKFCLSSFYVLCFKTSFGLSFRLLKAPTCKNAACIIW